MVIVWGSVDGVAVGRGEQAVNSRKKEERKRVSFFMEKPFEQLIAKS
jgi:hypothetical protein